MCTHITCLQKGICITHIPNTHMFNVSTQINILANTCTYKYEYRKKYVYAHTQACNKYAHEHSNVHVHEYTCAV